VTSNAESLGPTTKPPPSTKKLRLRTGLALQMLALLGVGLLLLSAFVVRQTRNDLVRQVDRNLASALKGRLRDNQNPGLANPQAAGQAMPPVHNDVEPGVMPFIRIPPGASSDPNSPEVPRLMVDQPPQPEAKLPQPTIEDLNLPPTATFIFDGTGKALSIRGSGSGGIADPLPLLDPQTIRLRTGRFFNAQAADGSMRFRAVSGNLGNQQFLVEAAPLRLVDAAVNDLIRTLTIGSLVVMGLAGVALYLLLRKALQPLSQIVTAAGVVATGNTGHGVAAKTGYREIEQLSQALDAMVTKLGAALDGQREAFQTQALATKRLRSFVSDASHELQTPVTSIRGWAELYRRGGLGNGANRGTSSGNSDEDAVGIAMLRIENEASRMGRLVDDLLALARADEQPAIVHLPVDLSLICTDAIEAARATAPARVIRFTASSQGSTDPASLLANETVAQQAAPSSGYAIGELNQLPSPFRVAGDADQLRQVLDNLLANVRSHTPDDTETSVHIEIVNTNVVVTVSDNGPGFDPEQLDHAFDRFWRADTSNRKSHGLGLAIVQAIANAHGGTVSAKNGNPSAPVRGASVTLCLPKYEAEDEVHLH
jgi:two-component system, OmpR family, sensor kinase